MDDEPPPPAESVEEEMSLPAQEGPPAWLLYAALGVGVVALIVGVLGFLAANGAKGDLARLETAVGTATEELAPQIEAVNERLGEIEASIASFENRMTGAGNEFVKLNRQDRQIGQDLQQGLENLQREIGRNRTQINALGEQVEEVGTRLASRPAPAPVQSIASNSSADTAPATPAATPPPDGVHVIQAGDTLSRVAVQYGISLSALERANPGVDSRRLRIGQHIYIPEP